MGAVESFLHVVTLSITVHINPFLWMHCIGFIFGQHSSMMAAMDAFRESWLHVLLQGEYSGATDLKSGALDIENMLRIVGDNAAYEHRTFDEQLRNLLSHLDSISFLSTLSASELAPFHGVLSVEEEDLLAYMVKTVNNQFLASEDTSLIKLLEAAGHAAGDHYSSIVDLAAILPFVRRTEVLLSIGGDDRLSITFNTDKLNKYLSSTIPRTTMLNRGSCTCSTISMDNFEFANRIRGNFIKAVLENAADHRDEDRVQIAVKKIFQANQSQLVAKLRNVMGLSPNEEDAQVVLFPSGSDAEYLPLVAALVRSHGLAGGDASRIRVVNYVSAAGEVGSGTAAAAGGRHFSTLSPRGDGKLTVDGLLDGIEADWVRVVQFKPRSGSTGEVDSQEEQILRRVRADLAAAPEVVAVVHVVCGSKTGLVHPSFNLVDLLKKEFGQRVLVVVDACQLRCELRHLQRYTNAGYLTLVTGSKFYTGPPFAGAVIVPNTIAQEIETHIEATFQKEKVCVVPVGLRSYLTDFEVPLTMPKLRNLLSADNNWLNFGLHLRWACSVHVMTRYAALSRDRVEAFTRAWTRRVRELVTSQSPYLRVLPSPEDNHAANHEMIGDVSGIVSVVVSVMDLEAIEERDAADSNNFLIPGFGMYVNGKKVTTPVAPPATTPAVVPLRALNFDQCKEFHKLMTLNTPSGGVEQVGPAVPVRCMLGQPVKLADNGFAVVRIALGADIVLRALEFGDHFEDILREDDAVVTKMALLAKNWHSAETKSSTATLAGKQAAVNQAVLIPQISFDTKVSTVTTAARVSSVLQHVYPAASVVPDVAIFYDLDALRANIGALRSSFSTALPAGVQFTHCFAIKAAPVTFLLQHMASQDLGMETASLMELKQALRVCAPSKIVFDSPCKSLSELDFALRRGVTINANSYAEVQKISTALGRLTRERVRSTSAIGLRVNPMVGAGAIDALSTATATSKFGVPSSYAGQEETGLLQGEADLREKIIKTYLEFPFLTGIMCHVGSQGMPAESMVQGALHILQLADEIDARSEAFGVSKRITFVDIGGGLSANYGSDEVVFTFSEYAEKLGAACGDLLRASPHRRIITEFGKAIITKTGVIATRVEEVVEQEALRVPAGGKRNVTAVVQAGADLLLRTAYCPDKFSHRLVLLDAHKQLLTSGGSTVTSHDDVWAVPSSVRAEASVTIAGPLCFSGDVLGRNLSLPEPRQGDICLVLDAGANTLSLFSRHCSRQSPAVYAFRKVGVQAPSFGQLRISGANNDAGAEKKEENSNTTEVFVVACIREQESEAELLSFWG